MEAGTRGNFYYIGDNNLPDQGQVGSFYIQNINGIGRMYLYLPEGFIPFTDSSGGTLSLDFGGLSSTSSALLDVVGSSDFM